MSRESFFLIILFIFFSTVNCYGQSFRITLPFDIYWEGNSAGGDNPLLEPLNNGVVEESEEGRLLIPFFNVQKSINIILDNMGFGATMSLMSGPVARSGGLESEVILRYIYHFPGFTRQFDCFTEGGFGFGFEINKKDLVQILYLTPESGGEDVSQTFYRSEGNDLTDNFVKVTFYPHLALGFKVLVLDYYFTFRMVYPIATYELSGIENQPGTWTMENIRFYVSIGKSVDIFK